MNNDLNVTNCAYRSGYGTNMLSDNVKNIIGFDMILKIKCGGIEVIKKADSPF